MDIRKKCAFNSRFLAYDEAKFGCLDGWMDGLIHD